MSDPKETYTKELDFQQVIFIGRVAMINEAATDGFDREFEDMVDLELWNIDHLIDDDTREVLKEIEGVGKDCALTDKIGMSKHKRIRIGRKLKLSTKILHKNRLWGKTVGKFKWDFNPEEYES
jgi:hypothetical protein